MPESGAAGDVRAGVAASPDALQCRTLCRAVGFALASRMLALVVDAGERDKRAARRIPPQPAVVSERDRSRAAVTCRGSTPVGRLGESVPKVIKNTFEAAGDSTQHLQEVISGR